MKAEMNDFEGLLQRRLLNAEATLPADPPEALLAFIDTVPTAHEQEPARPITLRRGKTIARGLALAAAAVVVAAIATQAIVNIRSSQNPGAGSSWIWRVPTGPKLSWVAAELPNGDVGHCASDDASLVPCSSPDGVNWSTPVDPAIASLDEGHSATFLPENVSEIGGIYVGVTIGGGSANLIRSADGTHWVAVHSDAIDEVLGTRVGVSYLSQAGRLADRFALIAGESDSTGWLFTSTDGVTWTRTSQLPANLGGDSLPGVAGFFVTNPDDGSVWRTVDGASWAKADLGSAGLPQAAVAMPQGGYLASEVRTGRILKSDDGATWHLDQGNLPGTPVAMVVIGDRVIASADPVGSGSPWSDDGVWESLDWGGTWRPVEGPGGRQMTGIVDSRGRVLEILQGSQVERRVAYVGFMSGETVASEAPATPQPTATPTPTERPVPTRLPDAVRSEWSWQATDGTRFEFPIAVPGGWLATCGTPGTSEFTDPALCWSADGLNWTESAQQEFVETQGSDPFWPIHAVQSEGVYVAFSLSRPIPFTGSGTPVLWRSTDGRTWTELHPPEFAGYAVSDVGMLGGRFVTIGTSADGGSGIVLGSPDGLAWSMIGDTPESPNGWNATVFGLVLSTGVNGLSGSWVSSDGASWVKATLPAGVTHLGGLPVRLAGGDYMDVGDDFISATHDTLMKSADGIAWTAVPTPDGRPMSFDQVGGRLILTMSLGTNNEAPYVAWQSSDDGQTWQSLPDPDGFPVDQITSSFGDRVTITYGDVPKIWIGTPTTR
jgi:hypothetical protein